jgi:hypothetical protein
MPHRPREDPSRQDERRFEVPREEPPRRQDDRRYDPRAERREVPRQERYDDPYVEDEGYRSRPASGAYGRGF